MTGRFPSGVFSLILCVGLLAGCATTLPPSFETTGGPDALPGPILAVAGERDLVVAANPEGLFRRRGSGAWERVDAPGIQKPGSVTCLAVNGEDIVVGTAGEGLHILSGGIWEVVTARYGGLADDEVVSVAFDGPEEGLPGETLWVGTREGFSARREGSWKVYTPRGHWLASVLEPGAGGGDVYVSSGFRLGRRGEDSSLFKPPVTAIGVGPDRVVFGNGSSRLVVIGAESLATFTIEGDFVITGLLVEKNTLWAGTDRGLLWGGVQGLAEGMPWPTLSGFLDRSSVFFGTRDTRGFEYRFKRLGYNLARVVALQLVGTDLWVAFNADESAGSGGSRSALRKDTESESATSGVRSYMNVAEYVARKERPFYENYGASAGIRSDLKSLFVEPEGGRVWIGTRRGLWELAR